MARWLRNLIVKLLRRRRWHMGATHYIRLSETDEFIDPPPAGEGPETSGEDYARRPIAFEVKGLSLPPGCEEIGIRGILEHSDGRVEVQWENDRNH